MKGHNSPERLTFGCCRAGVELYVQSSLHSQDVSNLDGASLDAAAVALRAAEFPQLAELSGKRLRDVVDGKRIAAVKAPGLLRLFDQTGANTWALMTRLDSAITRWDEANVPGWGEVRRSIGGADRRKFLSLCSELVVAGWAQDAGFTISEMEPRTGEHRADLRLTDGNDTLLVEVTTPWPAKADWTEQTNARLLESLRRLDTKLCVDVRLYDPLSFSLEGPEWGEPTRKFSIEEVDALVHRFAKAARSLDGALLPVVVVSSEEGQPVSITAVGRCSSGTEVAASGSRTGLVPNVARLAGHIRTERRQLGRDEPGVVLVDLSNWREFEPDDYYTRQVADDLARDPTLTSAGLFTWNPHEFAPEGRHALCRGGGWSQTGFGRAVLAAWSGG